MANLNKKGSIKMKVTFAQKLDKLFKTITKQNGEEYSPEEVQVATNKAITSSYIYRLRTGKSANPTIDKVKALADFFGIDPTYFFDEEDSEPRRDPSRLLSNLALRAQQIDLQAMEEMLSMIKAIREQQDDSSNK